MNRDRDPVGVDALMHPPVALALILRLCEAALRLSVAHLQKQTEREMACFILLRDAEGPPTRPPATWGGATRLAC